LPRPDETLIAIVGARAASRASTAVVAGLACDLGRDGFGIVSGGALGIDAAAHEGALAATGAATFAVLGCGIDVVYPDRHGPLFRQIAARGGLLSEHGPGVAPKMWHFPVRNRLVAALADAVVVAECRPGSGALITARFARRLGRRLLALPGSPGTDALILTGAARAVGSAAAVRAALDGAGEEPSPPADASSLALPGPYQALGQALAGGGRAASAEELALKLRVPLAEVLGVLSEAELDGWVRRLPGGRYEVFRGS
jgi:DNA processing protein